MCKNTPGDIETFYLHAFRFYVPEYVSYLFSTYGVGPGVLLMEGFENVNLTMKAKARYKTNRKVNIPQQILGHLLFDFLKMYRTTYLSVS